jgi:LysM repeat protein
MGDIVSRQGYLATLLIIGAFAFAACGGGDGDSPNPFTQTPASTLTPPPTETVAVETPVAPTETVPAETTYTVVSGDTLGVIAQRFNTTVAALAEANGIADPDSIEVGQVLVIPQ